MMKFLALALVILSLSAFSAERHPVSDRLGDPDSVTLCTMYGKRALMGNLYVYWNGGNAVDYQILDWKLGMDPDRTKIEQNKALQTVTLTSESNWIQNKSTIIKLFIDFKNNIAKMTTTYTIGEFPQKVWEDFTLSRCYLVKFEQR